MTQIRSVGGEIWENDGEKLGSRRGQLDIGHLAGNIQAQVLSAATSGYWARLLPVPATILNSHFKTTPVWGLRWPPLLQCASIGKAGLPVMYSQTFSVKCFAGGSSASCDSKLKLKSLSSFSTSWMVQDQRLSAACCEVGNNKLGYIHSQRIKEWSRVFARFFAKVKNENLGAFSVYLIYVHIQQAR